MTEEFSASNPIYLQLAERISKQIVRKELITGEKLPSVRDMALKSGVNPNTVQRTYGELERMGIVETRRGQGTFVTENKKTLDELRDKLKKEHIRVFIKDMQEMGFTSEEMFLGMKEQLEKVTKGDGNA